MNILEKHTILKERGQAIVLVAMALVGLIAILGLMIDIGTLFLESSKMKRAIDAAAVAASLEFREGVELDVKEDTPDLHTAAKEFIFLNEDEAYSIHTYICDDTKVVAEPEKYAGLCPDPTPNDTSDNQLYSGTDYPRKLVRVTGTKTVNFHFLPVIGIDGTTITTDAIGEAASIDLVLVIDASTSMADETKPEDGGKDFNICNNDPTKECQPFETVKGYASAFAQQLVLYPYDRVSVVSFDRLAHNVTSGNGWESHIDQIQDTIDSLMVYRDDMPYCDISLPAAGLCGAFTADGIFYQRCPHQEDTGDAASCTSSNLGAGLELANYQFTRDMHEEALWVVVLLAGGPANAISPTITHPAGYCPPGTSSPFPLVDGEQQPVCRDDRASERHAMGSVKYDGDDFARDKADQLVSDGFGAVVYTIGYGELINEDYRHRRTPYDPDIAARLLLYIAEEAGTPDLGMYLPAPTNAEVVEAFKKIAENIATKITQ